MLTFLLILIGIACVLLSLIVLIQNPKGGGIAANFSATNQLMGVKKTTDIVERLTWIFAIALIVLVLSTNYIRSETNAPVENKSLVPTENMPEGTTTPPPPGGGNTAPDSNGNN